MPISSIMGGIVRCLLFMFSWWREVSFLGYKVEDPSDWFHDGLL